MVFQPMERTAPGITAGTGELLPHLLTLIRRLTDGYFLLRYHALTDIFPLGSMVLSVVRTFLPLPCFIQKLVKSDRTAYYAAKL